MSADPRFMRRAIELARIGMNSGAGGPFGAVVVKDNEIVGEGYNRVIATLDPTAHGEVVAIRDACHKLGCFSLESCEIHTTGEPCPMCLGAILWSRIPRIYYGFSITDAATIGFDDREFYQQFSLPSGERKVPCTQFAAEEAKVLLGEYAALPGRVAY